MTESDVPAVVLAAGEGRRLEPLTNRRPKPMVPVANRPILEHVLESVVDAGIDRIVLVVGYQQERIRNYFGDGDDWGVNIEYVEQASQLGTAHAIEQARERVDGPFVVLNGDQIVDADLVERVRDELLATGEPVLSVTRSESASEYGIVTLEGETVTEIEEKPQVSTTAELINAGVYGFEPSIFDAIGETPTRDGELAITTTLEGLVEEESMRAVRYGGRWLDVSHLWDLLDVNAAQVDQDGGSSGRELAPSDSVLGQDVSTGPNATIGGATAIGDNVTIEANAVVSNAVVLPDAVVEAGAVVRNSIVGENARVGANATLTGDGATMVVDGEVHEGIALGAVVGDNAVVGAGVTAEPGTVLGDGAVVDAGATVGGRIEPDAVVRRG
ncbi:sugar phosphate nucleotidyltransferase [Natrarchaeobaculum aegyptiacum]|uniref:Bifunctional protein GlmU n=1 Tax=Natrarchaeobaculum aegyptiacum TaxID=745377 RepID=A0A2Z2HVM1_9EURY|nr:sugar phosphate nucleotidyltransferase [Natrarchaeobaculum aegyptiacum]ARS90823.1 glucose-1-phosphate thymidylyltransferase [Natrarchaeobaculum aegyptiacum]